MSIRSLKHIILRLSPEEKVVGIGSTAVIIGTFMPWYSVVMSFDKSNITQNGFGGDLGIIGFVVFLMSIITILVLIGDYIHIKIPQVGYTKEQILFFLMGENAFLILLAMAIYTKRSLDFTDTELRFGIYLALIGAFFSAFAAFAQLQKLKKEKAEKFFEHHEEEAPLKKDTKVRAIHAEDAEMHDKDTGIQDEDAGIHDVGDARMHPQKEEKPKLVPTEDEEYIPEDEMIEEIQEITKDIEKASTTAKKQEFYFTKEAGIGKKPTPVRDRHAYPQTTKTEKLPKTEKPPKTEEHKKIDENIKDEQKKQSEPSNLSMDFYDD